MLREQTSTAALDAAPGTAPHLHPAPPLRAADGERHPGWEIAARLDQLHVVDVTAEVETAIEEIGGSGLAVVSACSPGWVVRINERESGFFCDLQDLLARLAPATTRQRERLLTLLLGPTRDTIPFAAGALSVGGWQRVFLVGFAETRRCDWSLAVLGSGDVGASSHEIRLSS